MYYRDPCAEDKGIMDGVIDLNTVTAVTPLQVARNYGFQTVVSAAVFRGILRQRGMPVSFGRSSFALQN